RQPLSWKRFPMSSYSWIRNPFDRKPRTVRKAPARFRPWLQALDDRVLLSGLPPTVVTGAAGSLSTTGATVQATANPNRSSTHPRFPYSTDPPLTPSVASAPRPGFNHPPAPAAAP